MSGYPTEPTLHFHTSGPVFLLFPHLKRVCSSSVLVLLIIQDEAQMLCFPSLVLPKCDVFHICNIQNIEQLVCCRHLPVRSGLTLSINTQFGQTVHTC